MKIWIKQSNLDKIKKFVAKDKTKNMGVEVILCAVKLRHSWRRYKAETATPFLNLLENNYLLFFLLYV